MRVRMVSLRERTNERGDKDSGVCVIYVWAGMIARIAWTGSNMSRRGGKNPGILAFLRCMRPRLARTVDVSRRKAGF